MFKIKYYIYDLFRVDKKGEWNCSIQLWDPSTKLTLFTPYSRSSQSANNIIFNTSIIKRFYFELVLWPVLLLHFLFVFVCCCIFCLLLLPLLHLFCLRSYCLYYLLMAVLHFFFISCMLLWNFLFALLLQYLFAVLFEVLWYFKFFVVVVTFFVCQCYTPCLLHAFLVCYLCCCICCLLLLSLLFLLHFWQFVFYIKIVMCKLQQKIV